MALPQEGRMLLAILPALFGYGFLGVFYVFYVIVGFC